METTMTLNQAFQNAIKECTEFVNENVIVPYSDRPPYKGNALYTIMDYFILYKNYRDYSIPENALKAIKEFEKIKELYYSTKPNLKRGEIRYQVLKETLRREQENIPFTFTEIQKYCVDLRFSLPDGYLKGSNRGQYCHFLQTKKSYINTILNVEQNIFFIKEGKNYRLSEYGLKKLNEFSKKFSH
jgi:hypothetical protein